MTRLTLLLIFSIFFVSLALHNEKTDPNDLGELICSKKTAIYGYKNVMQYTKDQDNQDKSNTITFATVQTTCIKETKTGDLLFNLKLLHVNVTVRGKSEKIEKSDYADFSTYLMSPNGKLKKMWTTKKEAKYYPTITAIKKGIISNFQTKINGKQRIQKTQEGEILVLFEQKVLSDGELMIESRKRSKNVLKAGDPHQRRRDTNTNSKKYTIIKNGVQHKIVQETDDTVGKHKKSTSEKTIKLKKDVNPDLKSSDMFNVESRTEIILLREVNRDNQEKLKDKFENLEDLEEQDLGVDGKLLQQTELYHKERLRKEIDYPKLLDDIKETIKKGDPDLDGMNAASDYAKYLKNAALDETGRRFEDYITRDELEHYEFEFVRFLLVQLSAIDTRESQLLMLHGLKSKRLRFNTNVSLLALRKPIKEVIETLKSESSKKKNPKHVRQNAHLTLAHVASNLESKEDQQEVVVHLLNEMAKSESADDLEFHLHALSNAGEAVPLEVFAEILNSPIHLQGKVLAVNALSNRVSEEGDAETTAFVHSILSSDVDEVVKIAAVRAQTNREHVLQNGASLLEFKQYLDSEETSSVLSNVLRAYYEEADIHPAELESTSPENVLFFGRFFRRVGSFFRRAARAVTRVVRRVGSSIVRVAKKVGAGVVKAGKAIAKGVMTVVNKIKDLAGGVGKFFDNLKKQFGKAEFEGAAVCVPANNKGEKLCMHDNEMVAFIRSQGDLSIMKWSKQFTFERLIGAKILHIYVGAVGYGGTAIDCDNNTLDAVFFARADFYGKIFNRKINVLSMSIELAKRRDEDLRDKAYVKLGPAVLVNRQFVPDNIRNLINSCEPGSKPLIRKTFDKLAQFQFTIVVVVVPVRFGFVLTADMGIDLTYLICPSKLTLTVGVEPWFTLSVRAEAGISILVAHGGVSVTASFNYRLKPSVGTANCNICAIISQQIKPISILVEGYASAFGKRWSFKIYRWDGPTINQELFRKCLKDGPYNPGVSGNPNEQNNAVQPPTEQQQPTEQQPTQDGGAIQPAQTIISPSDTSGSVGTPISIAQNNVPQQRPVQNNVPQQRPVQQQFVPQQQTVQQQYFIQQQYAQQQYAQQMYYQQYAQWYQQQQGCGCSECCC